MNVRRAQWIVPAVAAVMLLLGGVSVWRTGPGTIAKVRSPLGSAPTAELPKAWAPDEPDASAPDLESPPPAEEPEGELPASADALGNAADAAFGIRCEFLNATDEECEGYLGWLKTAPPLDRAIGAVGLDPYFLAVGEREADGSPRPAAVAGFAARIFEILDDSSVAPLRGQLIGVLGHLPADEVVPGLIDRLTRAEVFSDRLLFALALCTCPDRRAAAAVAPWLDSARATDVALAATVILAAEPEADLLRRCLDRLVQAALPEGDVEEAILVSGARDRLERALCDHPGNPSDERRNP